MLTSCNANVLSYPTNDEPLANYYDGAFETVYILLHPFVRLPDELAPLIERYSGRTGRQTSSSTLPSKSVTQPSEPKVSAVCTSSSRSEAP